jgi:UDP-glucose 4-epimerase
MNPPNPKPAVLVTGGAGYIGSHAVLALLDAGWPVVVLDNLVTGFAWAVPDAAVFVPGDIADQALVARLIADHRIGAIIHFAGSVVVPESVENPLKYYDNNTVKSRSLIESAVKSGVPHFIFSSTAATYGIPDTVPVTETQRTEPINHRRRPSDQLLRLALLQRRRRRSQGSLGPVDGGRHPSDQGRGRGGDREA